MCAVSTQDPDPYARLFRDDASDEASPDVAQNIEIQEIVEIDDVDEVPWSSDDVVVQEIEVVQEQAIPAVDPGTGRLFRSVGATGVPEAIPALTSSQAGRLRSVRSDESQSVGVQTIRPDAAPPAEPGVESAPREYAPREPEIARPREGRITALGVYAGVIGVPTLIAFGQVLILGGPPGWITGAALVVVSIAAALSVRRSDDVTAIIAPPLAFLVVALTAGQVSGAGDTLTSRAVAAFFVLGYNWMWIVGATLAALVIVALRRRRAG